MSTINKVSSTAFDEIINGAGVIVTAFNPVSPTITDSTILFATSGGVNATAVPTYKDYGEDMDNAPKNTKELKKLDTWEVKLTGTATTVTTSAMKTLGGAATKTGDIVTLNNTLAEADFADLWWVGEKTEDNTVAYVKISNALSTGGIAIQTTDKEKGKFAFEFTGHYSSAEQDKVPFEYGEITITESEG